MNCDKCGKRLNDGDQFCSGCGSRVDLGMNWDVKGFPGEKPAPKRDTSMNWSSVQDSRDRKQVEALMNRRTGAFPEEFSPKPIEKGFRDKGFEESSVFFRNEEDSYPVNQNPIEFTEEDLISDIEVPANKQESTGATYRMEKERRQPAAPSEGDFSYGQSVFSASRGVDDGIHDETVGSNTFVFEKVDISDAIQKVPGPGEEPPQVGFEPDFKKYSNTEIEYPQDRSSQFTQRYTQDDLGTKPNDMPSEFEQRYSKDYSKDFSKEFSNDYSKEFSKDFARETNWDDIDDDFGKRRESFGGKFVAGVASVFGKLEKFARFDRDDDDGDFGDRRERRERRDRSERRDRRDYMDDDYRDSRRYRDDDFDDFDDDYRDQNYREDSNVNIRYDEPDDYRFQAITEKRATVTPDISWTAPGKKTSSRTTALDDWQRDIQEASMSGRKTTAAALGANATNREKFYTFNQKSAEFQALLDEEYERLRKRIQEESDEPQYSRPMPKPGRSREAFDSVVQKKAEPVEEPVEKAEPVVEEAVETVEPAVEPVVEEAVEAVEPAVEPVVEETVETVEPAVEPVVEETVETVEPVVEEALETVEPAAEPVVEETVEAVEPAADPVVEEPVAEAVEEVAETTEPAVETEIKEFDRQVVEPIAEETVETVEPAVEKAAPAEEIVIEEIPEPIARPAKTEHVDMDWGIRFENEPEPEDPELYEFERRINELEGQVGSLSDSAEKEEPISQPVSRSIEPEKPEEKQVETEEDLNKTRVFKADEVKTALHSDEENEFQRPLRYGDIFSNSGSIDYDKPRGGGRGKIILLDILIAILAIAVILTALMVFGRNTAIGQKLYGLFNKDAAVEETTGTEGTEEGSTQTETQPATPEISALSNAIIKQAVRNTNIGEIAEDTALKFVEGKDYGMENLQYASLFTDADWYTTGTGETVTYLPELVGHVIEYYSKLVNRYNNGSDEVLDLIDPYSNYYYDILAIEPEEGVTRILSKLQIGEIRRDEAEFYMLVRLMYDISNEEAPSIVTRVIKLDTSENRVYLEDIETVVDMETSTETVDETTTETTEETTDETTGETTEETTEDTAG